MCGIAGILNANGAAADLVERLAQMQTHLRHRGPDDQGMYVSPDARAGLAHTRLAILDLSPAGHQPMASADGRFHVTFNGEIYNFRSLKKELEAEGVVFKSESDTEVVLEMYRNFGPDCVKEFEGMYALAIWDNVEKTCFLARDPLGIKPLYYCQVGHRFAFASEIRALLKSGLASSNLSVHALRGYLLFGSVQEPDTLVEGVHCLQAGHSLVWRQGRTQLRRVWGLEFPGDRSNPEEAATAAREALEESVRRHFVSDVPVGVFLSGGIDSTALVALARRVGIEKVRTFCISFENSVFNEGDVAARTARHFATDHHDWRLDSTTGKALLRDFLTSLDQPSIDGFNTYCVAKCARDQGAKVVLSGLGGDELFAGYPSFSAVPKLAQVGRWLSMAGPCGRGVGGLMEKHMPQARHRRLGSFLAGPASVASAYWTMRGIFTPIEVTRLLAAYAPDGEPFHDEALRHFHVPAQPSPADEVSYIEITRYMRNQLLRDSDVMSMAWGLELRVPFVDRKLVETLVRIPASLRLAPEKRLLLDSVPEIPDWVAVRSKQGFVFPFEDWCADEWRSVFERLDDTAPVPLQNWYRRWCLFTLEHFLQTNDIATGRPIAIPGS